MKSLWEDVTESGYSNIDSLTGLDAATEADISARITDDPVDLAVYIGDCSAGMVAVEATLATIEGRCAVDYMRATTESAKAEVTAAMEGTISNAWETLKRYVQKAWKAIKKFLQEVWNKIKAKASTLKAMITKYEKVLRDSKVTGLKVSWATFKFKEMMNQRDQQLKFLSTAIKAVKDSKGGEYKDNAKRLTDGAGGYMDNKDAFGALRRAIWDNDHGPDYKQVDWNSIKSEAISVADGNVEKIIQDYMSLGEKDEREMLNELKDFDEETQDKRDDQKPGAARNKTTTIGRLIRAQLAISNEAARLLTSGVNAYRAQCVAACRKAIAASHGVKENYSPETGDANNFDSIMATMM